MTEPQRHRVCVIGSGWAFASGISYYTCRLATSLSDDDMAVSTVLMRRLIPRRMYPGRDRVGHDGFRLEYPDEIKVYDGVDWYWGLSIIGAIRFLRRNRPEVVVFQWWTGAVLHSYSLLGWIARRLGARVVVEFHETQDTGEAKIRGAGRYLRLIGRRFLSHADAFVTHSEFDRAEIARAFHQQGTPVTVIPHGPFDHHAPVPSAAQPATAQAATAEVDGAPEPADTAPSESAEMTVLFFGTIRPYKGLEHLVEAFGLLEPEEAQRIRLEIVGETWEGWTKPLELAERSRYRDRITVMNRYVTDEEVGGFFDRADAVVLPYTRSSASGPLHIAMAHGLPVVLSDVGGLRDGAEGYEGIRWVPPSDVEQLAEALRELPTVRGRRFADARSWAHTAESYRGVFAALAQR